MKNIKEITEAKVLKIIRNNFSFLEKNLLRKQYNELLYERENSDARIIAQPPYINSVNAIKYHDFAIFNWFKNIDIRLEVKSLISPTPLKNTIYEHYFESNNTPEKIFILFLSGEGYDEQVLGHIRNLIKKDKSKVVVIIGYDELDSYFKFILKCNKF